MPVEQTALFAQDGLDKTKTHRQFLDPPTLAALVRYAERLTTSENTFCVTSRTE
jgi:hypothetical protein